MTPTTQIQEFLNAAAKVKTGLTEMFQALSAIEAVSLDWAEATGNMGEYNTPTAPQPTPVPEPAPVVKPTQPTTPEKPSQTPTPAGESAVAETPTPEPAPAVPELTFEDVRSRLVHLAKQGYADAVKNMLTNLNLTKLSDLPEERYPEIMALADGIIQ